MIERKSSLLSLFVSLSRTFRCIPCIVQRHACVSLILKYRQVAKIRDNLATPDLQTHAIVFSLPLPAFILLAPFLCSPLQSGRAGDLSPILPRLASGGNATVMGDSFRCLVEIKRGTRRCAPFLDPRSVFCLRVLSLITDPGFLFSMMFPSESWPRYRSYESQSMNCSSLNSNERYE